MTEIEKGKLVGKITNYYSRIEVAALELTDALKVGDNIRIVGGQDTNFVQAVKSMEIEHQTVQEANSGDPVGLKVKEKVRKGYRVYIV